MTLGELCGSMYCMLEEFFGLDLAEYMWGNTPANDVNQFIGIAGWLTGISLFLCAVFYYGLRNPRWTRRWCWWLALGVNFAINFFVGWQYTLKDLWSGAMTYTDAATGEEICNVTGSNCLCFGVSNALWSIVFFFAFSLILKWWSTDAKYVPF